MRIILQILPKVIKGAVKAVKAGKKALSAAGKAAPKKKPLTPFQKRLEEGKKLRRYSDGTAVIPKATNISPGPGMGGKGFKSKIMLKREATKNAKHRTKGT